MTSTKARAVRRRRGSILKVPGARGVSYKLKFDLPSKRGEGRRTHYKTLRGVSYEEAEEELARLTGAANKGADLVGSKQPLCDWIEEWLAEIADTVDLPDEGISQRTYERYAELLRGHVVPHLGKYPLVVLSPRQIERLYVKLGKAGLSVQTRKHVHRVLHQCLGDAARYYHIENAAAQIKKKKQRKTGQQAKMHVLELETLFALFETVRESNYKSLPYPLPILAFDSGARRGELLAVRWSDLDMDKRTLRIDRAVDETKANGVVIKDDPKNESSRRTVPLSKLSIEVLRKWRARLAEDSLVLGKPLPADALIFPLSVETPHVPLRPREVTKSFSRIIAKRPDCTGFRLHDLRHCCASFMLNRGESIPKVSRHLGHASPQVTMAVYAHAIPESDGGIGLLDSLMPAAAE